MNTTIWGPISKLHLGTQKSQVRPSDIKLFYLYLDHQMMALYGKIYRECLIRTSNLSYHITYQLSSQLEVNSIIQRQKI